MFIIITTIILYDYDHYNMIFLCRNRDYNSSVGMRAMNYIIIKRYFFSMLIMQSNKSTEYILY